MAVVNTKSTSITSLDNTPRKVVNLNNDGARLRRKAETVEVVAADSDTSTYRLCRVHSRDVISSIGLYNDAITAGTSYDFGLYDTAELGGAVVDVDAFASAVDLSSARTTPTEIRFEAANIDTIRKAVWELLGLTADPNKEYDLVATANTVGSADGTISVDVRFVDGT